MHIIKLISFWARIHIPNAFAPIGVSEIHWLNIYGKELVDQLGRDRVLSTPCLRCEELAGGGVLFLSQPTPLDYASDEARIAQASALAHLRSDVTYEQALAMLCQRSVTLFPTKEHWDPDIVDLLELTQNFFSFEERPAPSGSTQYVSSLQKFLEWLPLDQAVALRCGRNQVRALSTILVYAKPLRVDSAPEEK